MQDTIAHIILWGLLLWIMSIALKLRHLLHPRAAQGHIVPYLACWTAAALSWIFAALMALSIA